MISQSLTHLGIAELQKAVLGMNPAIKPYAALAALQEKVKSEQMKQGQAMQNPAQPPVAQQMMAQAQQLTPAQVNNPYMASGLGAAPVQSPVQAPTANMASGGIIAFDEGGEVPRFDGRTGSRVTDYSGDPMTGYTGAEEEVPGGGDGSLLFDKYGNSRLRNSPLRVYPGFNLIPQDKNDTRNFFERLTNAPRQLGKEGAARDIKKAQADELKAAKDLVDASKGETAPAPIKTETAPVAGATPTTASVAKGKKEAAPSEGGGKESPVGLAQAAASKDRYKVEPQYKTMEDFMAARKAAEAGTDKLPEDEYSKALRANLNKREERLAQTEKRGDQMAALQAAGHFFGPGNLLQNAKTGIAAYADAKIKGNAALEAAQEKSLDAQDAWARYNQARQDGNKKDMREAFKDFNAYNNQAKTLQLTATKYEDDARYHDVAGKAALMTAQAAQTRAGALANYDKSALTQFQQGKLLDMANDNVQKMLDSSPTIMLKAQKAAKDAGQPFDPISYRNRLVQEEIQKMQRGMTGGNTMAPASPAGGGSGAKFLGFE
jgi:hypothetical protein